MSNPMATQKGTSDPITIGSKHKNMVMFIGLWYEPFPFTSAKLLPGLCVHFGFYLVDLIPVTFTMLLPLFCGHCPKCWMLEDPLPFRGGPWVTGLWPHAGARPLTCSNSHTAALLWVQGPGLQPSLASAPLNHLLAGLEWHPDWLLPPITCHPVVKRDHCGLQRGLSRSSQRGNHVGAGSALLRARSHVQRAGRAGGRHVV